jgi:hypothetical protein
MAGPQVQGFTKHDDNTDREKAEIDALSESAKERRKRTEEAWSACMKMPEGRAIIADVLIRFLGGFRGTYWSGMQPHDIIANAAVQSQGAALNEFLATNYPAYYREMLKENGR